MAKKRKILTPQEQIDAAEYLLQWTAEHRLGQYYQSVIGQAIEVLQKMVALNATPLENAGVFYAAQRQSALLAHIAQIADIYARTGAEAASMATDYATQAGAESYVSTLFALEVTRAEFAEFSFMDSHAWQAIADGYVAGSNISERMAKRTGRTAAELTELLTQGLAAGKDSAQMAAMVREQGTQLFRYTRSVTHNEMGRLYSAGNKVGLQQAAALGIEGRKTWYSNRDKRVRHDHAILDGHTIAYDAEFEISGHTAQMPHEFGVASEDINCRCRVHITRKGADTIRTSNGKGFDTLAEFKAWAWEQSGQATL